MSENTSDKKKINPILIFLLVLIGILAVVIIGSVISGNMTMNEVALHAENGDWEIVSDDLYIRDGKECIGYRVYVNAKYGNTDVYKNIFSYITEDDGYYLHTVWIYFLKSSANGSYSADYIMEQTRQGQLPEPIKQ